MSSVDIEEVADTAAPRALSASSVTQGRAAVVGMIASDRNARYCLSLGPHAAHQVAHAARGMHAHVRRHTHPQRRDC